ncbi:MAG: heterodisulfide reductase [Deltaproteobacteria bacterium]|nr:MAG: heterodisulfide reductase [Deltaproteobacteria bacterium]
MTLCEVTDISGEVGNFKVTVKEAPRYVDVDKCIACGACTAKCPKKVDSEYDAATGKRKAIYVKYSQAVPLKYQIDPDQCIRLGAIRKGKEKLPCGLCEKVCDAGAINYYDTEKTHEINVGAVVMAPGFEAYDPTDAKVWGFGEYPNVVTSLQFERYLSATGPTEGHLIRPSDGKPVKRVAFLQCVGSRDQKLCGNGYCSSVCCMYAIKEAVIAKAHEPGLDASIFYMDIRTHGKEFDQYMERAKDENGVNFIRCKVNSVEPHGDAGDLRLSYVESNGIQVEEHFDLVVLSVGLETPKHVLELAEKAGIEVTSDRFAKTSDFTPVTTTREGIFTAGSFAGPKDIPQAVVEGSAAAAAVADVLAPVRNELAQEASFPEERNISGEEPKIGVFVCHCGSNIAGYVDVKAVEAYAKTLPDVVHVERNLFTCSQDAQEGLAARIKELGLNRVVIAACTPRTHEPLFRETLKSAGLNEYLVEMANIRNHNSWVHDNNEAATKKACDLVRMAVAKVMYSASLAPISVPITQTALVIGGGVAGMTSALNLADQGFVVSLVERTGKLGGAAMKLRHTWSGEEVQPQIASLIDRVKNNGKITLYMETEVASAQGFVGNFKTTLRGKDGTETEVKHGAGVVAIGGDAYQPNEYGYGQIPGVVNGIDFDDADKTGKNTFVFIQCVGSREGDHMYCSKVCCTHSVQSAIELKKEDPSRRVYILYRDMRTYGQRENLYREARRLGVMFINYEVHGKPEVSQNGEVIDVKVIDHVLARPVIIKADMVVLASAIRPKNDAQTLSQMYKVSLDADGFFQEAHAKLRPVDFATDGMFVAGMAHYPKPLEESVAQALAASARAATLLSKLEVTLDAIKAQPVSHNCDGCALCVDVCPYNAISLLHVKPKEEGGMMTKCIDVNKAKCKGCGLCQATCPKGGVNVAGFTLKQLSSQVTAALSI